MRERRASRTSLRGAGVVVAASALLAAGTTTHVTGATAQGNSSAYCGYPGFGTTHRFVWTGPASGGSWYTPANWNNGTGPDRVPGDLSGPTPISRRNSQRADYVCIGHGASVHLPVGEHVALAALDVGAAAKLVLRHSSAVFLNGDPTVHPSTIRSGATLQLLGSTLGGTGTLDVAGRFRMTAVPGSAATQLSWYCDPTRCSDQTTEAPGHTVIETGGEFDVDGTAHDGAVPFGGINVDGRRVIDNYGLIRIVNRGYIAADDGTTLHNRASGTVVIANDYGIYEGFVIKGLPPPSLINDGTVAREKSGGHALIGAGYSGSGHVRVDRGTLSIAGTVVPSAVVAPGSGFSNSGCVRTECRKGALTTSATVRRAALVRLGARAHTTRVSITLQRPSAGDIAGPVLLSAPDAHAIRALPVIAQLRYDDSLVGGRKLATLHLRGIVDGRRVPLRRCTASGGVPAGVGSCASPPNCLGSPGSGQRADGSCDGDVAFLVRTIQPSSRWVIV